MSVGLTWLILLLGLSGHVDAQWTAEQFGWTACTTSITNISTVAELKVALSLTAYQPTVSPTPRPRQVSTLMSVRNVYSISTKTGAYWADIVLSQVWLDCGLAYTANNGSRELDYVGMLDCTGLGDTCCQAHAGHWPPYCN